VHIRLGFLLGFHCHLFFLFDYGSRIRKETLFTWSGVPRSLFFVKQFVGFAY
jgi:hypothetical protein